MQGIVVKATKGKNQEKSWRKIIQSRSPDYGILLFGIRGIRGYLFKGGIKTYLFKKASMVTPRASVIMIERFSLDCRK